MRLLIFSLFPLFIFCGCSNILMPYQDEFSCTKGLGAGRCASMSENYEAIQQENGVSKNARSDVYYVSPDKNITCERCEAEREAVWLRQRALEKKYGIH